MVKTLWILFIAGQIINAGNMNYQQENGYYETNDKVYGKHPSKERVYITKVFETGGLYVATKIFPKYEKPILAGANIVVWGFIYQDDRKGIKLGFEW